MGKKLQANSKFEQLDKNSDSIVSDSELLQEDKILELQNKQAMLENEDKRQDAQREMAWFALFGMLLYPFAVVLASWLKLPEAPTILGSMAPTYFVSVAAIVAAFYGTQAFSKRVE